MSLRIYWRSGRTRRCVAHLAVAATFAAPLAALASPDPKVQPADRVTAREAVERQLAAPAVRDGELSGVEAQQLMKLYQGRIGKILEPRREISGGRGDR